MRRGANAGIISLYRELVGLLALCMSAHFIEGSSRPPLTPRLAKILAVNGCILCIIRRPFPALPFRFFAGISVICSRLAGQAE